MWKILFQEKIVVYLHIYQHLLIHSYPALPLHSLFTCTAPCSFFLSWWAVLQMNTIRRLISSIKLRSPLVLMPYFFLFFYWNRSSTPAISKNKAKNTFILCFHLWNILCKSYLKYLWTSKFLVPVAWIFFPYSTSSS